MCVLFADLPSNDYNALLANAAALDNAQLGTWSAAKVGFAAKPITDPDSVHLVMCFSTVHWIQNLPWSADPARRGGSVSYATLQPAPMAELREAADTELHSFFSSRHAELRAGGQMVMAFDGETDDGSLHQFSCTYTLLEEALRAMVRDGRLPSDFLSHFFIPTASFSSARCEAALSRCPKTTVVESRFLDIPCPYLLEWRNGGDPGRHGSAVAGAILACVKQQLLDSMFQSGVAMAEGPALVDLLLTRMTQLAAEAPAKFHTGGITAFMHIAK